MKNPFDQFDGAAAVAEANPFDQFDEAPKANPFDQFDEAPKPAAPIAPRFDVQGAAETAKTAPQDAIPFGRGDVAWVVRNYAGPAVGLVTLATTANPLAAAGMTAAGGALGSAIANALEGKDGTILENTRAGAVQGLGMAIPGVGRVTTPALAANRPVLAMGAELAAPAAAAGTVGAGITALDQATATGSVNWQEVAKAGGINAVLGAIGGSLNALEAGRMAAVDRAGLLQAARSVGFKGQTFDELRAWYRAQEAAAQAPRTRPVSPAQEGAPVPEGQIQPLTDAYWTEQAAQAKAPLALPPAADAPAPAAAPPVEGPMPPWVRQEMINRGLDPARPFNDADLANQSVRDAIASDPTLTPEQRANLIATGSPASVSPEGGVTNGQEGQTEGLLTAPEAPAVVAPDATAPQPTTLPAAPDNSPPAPVSTAGAESPPSANPFDQFDPALAPAGPDWLKVDLPGDVSVAEENVRVADRQIKELNQEIKRVQEMIAALRPKVMTTRRDAYHRSGLERVKAGAKPSDVKQFQALQADAQNLMQKASAVHDLVRKDREKTTAATNAKRVNDPNLPRVIRLANRLSYENQQQQVSPAVDDLLKTWNAAAAEEVRRKYPDATDAEVELLTKQLEGYALGAQDAAELDRNWSIARELDLNRIRREELKKAADDAKLIQWSQEAPDLASEVNKALATQRPWEQRNEPLPPISRAQVDDLKSRLVNEREQMAAREEAKRKAQEEAAAKEAARQGLTKVITGDSEVITPTPSLERQVSKLSTRKQLQAQSEFLEKTLLRLAAEAPSPRDIHPDYQADYETAVKLRGDWRAGKNVDQASSGIASMAEKYIPNWKQLHSDKSAARGALAEAVVRAIEAKVPEGTPAKIVIHVPNDGTFTFTNWKDTLVAAAKEVGKGLGRGLTYVGPSTPGSGPRSMPKPVKQAPAEINKVLQDFVTDKKERPNSVVLQDGSWTFATDGVTFLLTKGGAGKTRDKVHGEFPQWRTLLSAFGVQLSDKQGERIILGPGAKVDVPLDELLKKTSSAVAALQEDEKKPWVQVHIAGDKVGLSYRGVGADYLSEGVRPGQESDGAVNATKLRDALEGLRRLGATEVRLQIKDKKVFILRGGDERLAIVMGVDQKAMEPAPADADQVSVPEDWPKPSAQPTTPPPSAEDKAKMDFEDFMGEVAKALNAIEPRTPAVTPSAQAAYHARVTKVLTGMGIPVDVIEFTRSNSNREKAGKVVVPWTGERYVDALKREQKVTDWFSSVQKKQQKGRQGAHASPDFAASPPMGAPPNQPPRNQPPPAADPNFSQLPIELPEAVQFFKLFTQGQYPAVRARLRVLGGNAAGVFYYKEGDPKSGRIELRADIFNLLTLEQKRDLLRQAVAWATQMKQIDPSLNERDLIKSKFEELVRQAERESIIAGPRRALATFWHEIGHFLDFFPSATTQRGNILGRMASLHHYFKGFLGKAPGIVADPPTQAERAKMRRQAEKELVDSVASIVETIRREEPVYREIPITAETVTGIVKNLARDEFPAFYDWFAKLDRATKADVLRKAMKGIVDERAAQFSRREPTGEVKVVEETVTRTTGTPPTPEAIAARYQELLRAELERRGLINEKEIREELSRAIAWWRGTKTIPDYFKPSVEMWADAMSIFFNNPRGLAERAPKFYEAFMQWMAAKPGLREEYDKFQRDIASGQIYKDRVVNLRDVFAKGDRNAIIFDEQSVKTPMGEMVDAARILFDRQLGPIERRVGRNPSDAAGRNVLDAIGNYRYRTTAWEAFALDLRNSVEVKLHDAGLTHMDFAEYLFHKRITEGRYRDLAAPLGWNPKASTERLAEMEAQLGPHRWDALVKAQQALRGIYVRHVLEPLHKSGVMSPELAAAVDQEVFYAPFNSQKVFVGENLDLIKALVELHAGSDAGGQIYSAVGNLGEIKSPYAQLMHRGFGLISMAYRQIAVKRVIAWMMKHEPLHIMEAELRWNGRGLEPVKKEGVRFTTLYTLEASKVKAYYVPKVIGEMFARGGALEMMMIAASHTLLSPPKAILTEFNPGFWPVAFAKDILAAVVQLPGGSAIIRNLPRAYLAARHTMYGKTDPLAQKALDRMVLTSRADSRGEHLQHGDEITRILLRLGKSPVLLNAEVGRIEHALTVFFRAWAQEGQVFERTVKIAAMMALDQKFPDMPEGRKREMIRQYGGSPDFQSKGRWARVIELGGGLMFFNAWKEGVRSTARSMSDDPVGFWSKFASTVGAAGLLLWALEEGIVGDDADEYRAMLRSIPERDKLRGLVIPLGWEDQRAGKVVYMLLPWPDSLRWAHALQRKTLQSLTGQAAESEGLGTALQYQGQDLPGDNPWVVTAKELWAYFVEGRNPYDSFTGRGALDETAVKAGEAGPEMLKRAASNSTGGTVYRFRSERPGETPTKLEEFLRAPAVANLVGRWVRVSSRGLDEYYTNAKAPVEKEEASLRLVGEDMIGRSLKGEAWSKEQMALISESPYLAKYLVDAAPRIIQAADSPFLRALTQATTTAEKLAIIQAESRRMQAAQRAKVSP